MVKGIFYYALFFTVYKALLKQYMALSLVVK